VSIAEQSVELAQKLDRQRIQQRRRYVYRDAAEHLIDRRPIQQGYPGFSGPLVMSFAPVVLVRVSPFFSRMPRPILPLFKLMKNARPNVLV
jgi:hypothetical protein